MPVKEKSCDILIVGGGTGGVAAALAAVSLGHKVILTEEFEWIGGQLTSQIVPPDEHPWIEQFGCTANYRRFREAVRAYYRAHFSLTASAKKNLHLNPGGGWVSRLCFEPKIGWRVLCEMVRPGVESGLLQIETQTIPTSADLEGDEIRSVTVQSIVTGEKMEIVARYFLDATETGDLLPMTNTEYRLGAESKAQTRELHARDEADSGMVQGLTWCAAFAYDDGSHRTITRPENYEKWKNIQPKNWSGKLFDFEIIHPITGARRELPLFPKTSDQWYTLFSYRQIVDPTIFAAWEGVHPATVVNWPMNDYYLNSIIDVPEADRKLAIAESKELTMSLLYWLQTDAPRHDGGVGYPGLYLRPDLTGTNDGLAQAPYIRESRRIESQYNITEEWVGYGPDLPNNKGKTRADPMPLSIGVGAYRMDIHPRTNFGPTLDLGSLPYQIPLGSILPIRMKNLLAAGKNLGVTHLTNGCYRLHPTEWNIGESAGLLCAFCLHKNVSPQSVYESEPFFKEFESLMVQQGIEASWPELRAL